MARPRDSDRNREIARVQRQLERNSYPRLQMFLLVALTGAAGFLASFCLLRVGMTTMAVRYLAAITVAYVVFLLLLWIWLRWRASEYIDATDAVSDVADLSSSGSRSLFQGSDSGLGDALGGADLEAIPLLLLIALGAVLLSIVFVMFSVVSAAPVLFAELLVDGLLSASLYRRMRGIDQQHWLQSAVKRTLWPFVITAALACVTGLALGKYAPGAHSIGEAIRMGMVQR